VAFVVRRVCPEAWPLNTCWPDKAHRGSSGAVANPLWRTKHTWRDVEGGMPGRQASAPSGTAVRGTEISKIVISEVRMHTVPHLASHDGAHTPSPSTASNAMGNGVSHDYLEFTDNSDLVLTDVVRTAAMEPVSRAYLRAGPRASLYFHPTEVRAAIVTCGG
jgi:hypothetical protein